MARDVARLISPLAAVPRGGAVDGRARLRGFPGCGGSVRKVSSRRPVSSKGVARFRVLNVSRGASFWCAIPRWGNPTFAARNAKTKEQNGPGGSRRAPSHHAGGRRWLALVGLGREGAAVRGWGGPAVRHQGCPRPGRARSEAKRSGAVGGGGAPSRRGCGSRAAGGALRRGLLRPPAKRTARWCGKWGTHISFAASVGLATWRGSGSGRGRVRRGFLGVAWGRGGASGLRGGVGARPASAAFARPRGRPFPAPRGRSPKSHFTLPRFAMGAPGVFSSWGKPLPAWPPGARRGGGRGASSPGRDGLVFGPWRFLVGALWGAGVGSRARAGRVAGAMRPPPPGFLACAGSAVSRLGAGWSAAGLGRLRGC